MKTLNRKLMVTLAVVGISALNTACGGAPMPVATGIIAAPGAFVGGSACITGVSGQSPVIGFQGTNILYTSDSRFIGGALPTGQNVGTMTVAGAGAAAGQFVSYPGSPNPDGTISLNVSNFSQVPTTANTSGQTVNVTGALTLSTLRASMLMQALNMSAYNNYGTGMTMPMVQQQQQLCFRGIAMNMGVAMNKYLYNGQIYLTGATMGITQAASSQPIVLTW